MASGDENDNYMLSQDSNVVHARSTDRYNFCAPMRREIIYYKG